MRSKYVRYDSNSPADEVEGCGRSNLLLRHLHHKAREDDGRCEQHEVLEAVVVRNHSALHPRRNFGGQRRVRELLVEAREHRSLVRVEVDERHEVRHPHGRTVQGRFKRSGSVEE